jgi:hypothetical protein
MMTPDQNLKDPMILDEMMNDDDMMMMIWWNLI